MNLLDLSDGEYLHAGFINFEISSDILDQFFKSGGGNAERFSNHRSVANLYQRNIRLIDLETIRTLDFFNVQV